MQLNPFLVQLLLNIASSNLFSKRPRMWLYRQLGVKMGSGVSINFGCQISRLHLSNIYLCCNVSINTQCHLEAGAEILIGEETCLAPGVRILTTTHQIGGSDRRTGYSFECRPVSIGAGCWICANVLILPGVVIPDGCVVAAGAVVVQSLTEPNCLYAGVPARLVRKLDKDEVVRRSVTQRDQLQVLDCDLSSAIQSTRLPLARRQRGFLGSFDRT